MKTIRWWVEYEDLNGDKFLRPATKDDLRYLLARIDNVLVEAK